jgi:hypothetical protein
MKTEYAKPSCPLRSLSRLDEAGINPRQPDAGKAFLL